MTGVLALYLSNMLNDTYTDNVLISILIPISIPIQKQIPTEEKFQKDQIVTASKLT